MPVVLAVGEMSGNKALKWAQCCHNTQPVRGHQITFHKSPFEIIKIFPLYSSKIFTENVKTIEHNIVLWNLFGILDEWWRMNHCQRKGKCTTLKCLTKNPIFTKGTKIFDETNEGWLILIHIWSTQSKFWRIGRAGPIFLLLSFIWKLAFKNVEWALGTGLREQ